MQLSYGEKIKQYRNSNNLTQEQLAEQLTISSSMLRMIELGQRKPNKEVQKDIYNLTNICYTDELKNEIDNKINELMINYIASNVQFFTPTNISSLVRSLSNVTVFMHPKNGFTVVTRQIENESEEQQYMVYNIIELLNNFTKDSTYDIDSIYGNNIEFVNYYLPIVIEILSKSGSIIYKNKEIPLYTEDLPAEIKKKTVKRILSEDYFLDSSKFAYIIQDNAMFPKYEKGYTIIAVECDEKNTNGDVIVSINNNTPILRKLTFQNDIAILESYNQEIETKIYNKKDIKILGKIIEIRFF